MELLDEQPKGKQDYDSWISNGVILSKGIKIIVCVISFRKMSLNRLGDFLFLFFRISKCHVFFQ